MKKALLLNLAEIGHLLTLLCETKEEGSYYGRQDFYYARTDKLIDKLNRLHEIDKA